MDDGLLDSFEHEEMSGKFPVITASGILHVLKALEDFIRVFVV